MGNLHGEDEEMLYFMTDAGTMDYLAKQAFMCIFKEERREE